MYLFFLSTHTFTLMYLNCTTYFIKRLITACDFKYLTLVFLCDFLFSLSVMRMQLREPRSGWAKHPRTTLPVLHVSQNIVYKDHSPLPRFFSRYRFSFRFLLQGSCVHVEQAKPAPSWSSQFSCATGSCIRSHPPGPGRTAPSSPGQASVWSYSNYKAVHGGTGPWQHPNRGPHEPTTSLKKKERELTGRTSQDGFGGRRVTKQISPGV